MKKCLITGAAGFIGSHLIDRLLKQGCEVVGIDNMKLGRRENLRQALADSRCRFYEADVNDYQTLVRVVSTAVESGPFDTVWHLAANSDIRSGVADAEVDLRDTFLTTHHTLRMMRELSIKQIAFASTSAVYGVHDCPLREDLGPLFPISNYGAMKLASEAAISSALESFLEKAWIFRFPNVVGSRSTHGAIYDFVQKLAKNPNRLEVLGDGTQEKPYFHVADLIDAMLFITEHGKEKLNYYNIGTAETATSVRYLAEAVVREMSPKATIQYGSGKKGWVGDVPKFKYSVEKLSRLGWSPHMTSDEAVNLAVKELVAEASA